jgi:hypothetical protein
MMKFYPFRTWIRAALLLAGILALFGFASFVLVKYQVGLNGELSQYEKCLAAHGFDYCRAEALGVIKHGR